MKRSQRTLTYYTEILKREMDKATQRKHYRHLIRHLEKMKTYPGGESAARNLSAYWYGYHKNRPAMKDELQKAGYPQKQEKADRFSGLSAFVRPIKHLSTMM